MIMREFKGGRTFWESLFLDKGEENLPESSVGINFTKAVTGA